MSYTGWELKPNDTEDYLLYHDGQLVRVFADPQDAADYVMDVESGNIPFEN